MVAEVELNVGVCNQMSIRVACFHMNLEQTADDLKSEVADMVVSFCKHSVRVRGGEVTRMGDFLMHMRDRGCGANIAAWKPCF